MSTTGFSEEALVANRSPVLIHGSTQDERRAWAAEAAEALGDLPLVEVTNAAGLSLALKRPGSVLFAPDLGALGSDGQAQLVQCLHGFEERPKLVLALGTSVENAEAKGLLRTDLSYRLRLSRVNLDADPVKARISTRRAKSAAKAAKAAAKPAASKAPVAKVPAKKAVARR